MSDTVLTGGFELANSIDQGFPDVAPDTLCVPCLVKAFAKGFVKGFVPAFAIGLVVGAVLAAVSAPVWITAALAVVGLGLLATAVVSLARQWRQLTPEQRAEGVGELVGSTAGGLAGAKVGKGLVRPGTPGKAGPIVDKPLRGGTSGSGPNTVVRYAGPVEARIAKETGFIPNTDRFGAPKSVYVTPESPLASALEAESAYQIGAQNPVAPTQTPTHVIIGDATGIKFTYGGNVEGGSGIEMMTTQRIPVISVQPIGKP